MQKISQIHQQTAKVEEAPSRFHVDQKVYIAVWSGLAPRHRAEDADVQCAMLSSDAEDLCSLVP